MADAASRPDGEETRTLLIVEDNDRFAETLGSEFRDRGYLVERARDLTSLDRLERPTFDFAVVDLRLGADSGLGHSPARASAHALVDAIAVGVAHGLVGGLLLGHRVLFAP